MPAVEGGFVTGDEQQELLRLFERATAKKEPEPEPERSSFSAEEWEERMKAHQRESVTAGGTRVVDRRGQR